jgi:3-oxo-5alpha-steroid 4-dehydrogenase
VRYRSKATRLIVDDEGRVIGLEVKTLSSNPFVRALHHLLYSLATHVGSFSMVCLKMFASWVAKLEDAFSRVSRIRVRGGVVLASGGFIFNPEWTRRYIPKYFKTMRLGTMGDDGSGIALGLSVGAGVRKMERGTAWMFINPPAGLAKGLLVSRKGERICNEERYGAALGEAIAEFHEGKALLLLDQKSWRETRDQIFRERKANFQTLMAAINLWFNNAKAHSLEELAVKTGVPSGALRDAVEQYNKGVDAESDDMGKSVEFSMRIDTPPYYAVDCDIDNRKFITPSISLGGLSIDGLTSRVQREDGSPIEGLFAAGRTAVGVCSQHYVSGLSIADCVFSGRNAGRSAAEAASKANVRTAC